MSEALFQFTAPDGKTYSQWTDLHNHGDVGTLEEYLLESCRECIGDDDEEVDLSDVEFEAIEFRDLPDFARDYGCFSGLAIALEYADLDDDDREIWVAYEEIAGSAAEGFAPAQEAYNGHHESEAEFCQQLAEDAGEVPSDISNWIVIDWQATWDQNLRHDYTSCPLEDSRGVIIFRDI